MLSSKRKAHLIIITTFVLGIVVGASGQYLLFRQSAPRPPSVAEVAGELARTVQLDQTQRSQVEQILNESRQQYRQLRDATRPQNLAIRDNARNRIRALLSAEQRDRYDRWLKELDASREKKSSEEGKHSDK
jgi:uncharacterized membrane protein